MSIWLLMAVLAAPPPASAPTVDITAERLELDQKAGTARFEGAVQVKRGRLTLTCATLDARYADGRIEALSAGGGITVKGPDWTARATAATWDRAAGRLVLTGDPRIERGPDVLRGAKVIVWPDDERLVVEQARGTFRPPALNAP